MVVPKSHLGRTPLVDITSILEKQNQSGRWFDLTEAEIKCMLEQGLIHPSESPWASPVVLI